MLVLTRKVGESIVVDGGIEIKVQRIAGKRVTIAIEAPADVKILRGEIADRREERWEEPTTWRTGRPVSA